MSAGGKGHEQRPTDHKKFSENYDRIFGKKNEQTDKNSFSTERTLAQDRTSGEETLPPT